MSDERRGGMNDNKFTVREIRADYFRSDFSEIIQECLITNLKNEIRDESNENPTAQDFEDEAEDLLCSLMGNQAEGPSTLTQLMGYLECLDDSPARCAVIERNYIDRDFLDDYVSYYSRCYANHLRKCCRVHFFSENIKDEIDDLILNPEQKTTRVGKKKISDIYLGFLVVRPLRQAIVGRTCLKSYKENNPTDTAKSGRHYLAVRETEVSLFGVSLSVKGMQFQEQDHITAACASCALWSAFSVSAPLFRNCVPSPSAITALAVENSFSSNRMFPNQGLSLDEMCYAVRKMGLDPVVIKLDQYSKPDDCDHMFRGAVYAYLNLGVSVIAILDAKGRYGYGETEGTHAVAINGYHLVDESEKCEAGNSDAKRWLEAMRIDKFYANDDQCCPGAIFKPMRNVGDCLKIEAYHGHKTPADESTESKLYRTYVPCALIVPLHRKIHVTFEHVAKEMETCFGALSFAAGQIPGGNDTIRLDITLRESNAIKAELRNDECLADKNKRSLVTKDLSRFVWCVRISYKGKKEAVLLIDTTDFEQGLNVLAICFYSPDPNKRKVNNICRLSNNALLYCLSRSCPRKFRDVVLGHKIIRALGNRTVDRKGDFENYLARSQSREGKPEDQYTLAWMYEHAEGTEQNLSEAVKWYKAAAERHYADAMFNLAGVYEDLSLNENNNQQCSSSIGRYKPDGNGNPVEAEGGESFCDLAKKWYEHLAKDETCVSNSQEAWFRLGEIYKREGDVREAVVCYRNASNEKHPEDGYQLAQLELAKMYENGGKNSDGEEVVRRNNVEALKLYRHICEMAEIAQILNSTYAEAAFKCGVLSTEKAAMDWYEKAARQGHMQAQYNLGYLYDTGRHYGKTAQAGWNIAINKNKAMHWYELAAGQGHQEAAKALANLKEEW